MQDFFQDLGFPASLHPCPQPALETQTFSQATLQAPLPRAHHACHSAMPTALLLYSPARAPSQRPCNELGWMNVGLDAWLDACWLDRAIKEAC